MSFADIHDRFVAVRDAFNGSDPDDYSLSDDFNSADDELRAAEPESAADFIRKFRALWYDDANPGRDVIAAMLDSGERLLAAPTSPIGEAFAEHCAAYKGLHDLPFQATDEDAQPFHDRIDAAREIIRDTPSQSPEDKACKLRVALAGINQGAAASLVMFRLAAPGTDPELDYFEEMVFAVIEALEAGR